MRLWAWGAVFLGSACLGEDSEAFEDDGDHYCEYPGRCSPPKSTLFSVVSAVSPRRQWDSDGGYAGALTVQAIALNYGVWISQSLVRKAASEGGGHGDAKAGWEILHTNLGSALDKLHFTWEAYDSSTSPTPQGASYLPWLKGHLGDGSPVAWFVMCEGDGHDAYGIPNATYDHIQPVFGIYSNYSINASGVVHGDDVLVHGSDYAPDGKKNRGYYRRFDSLLDSTKMLGNCSKASKTYKEAYPCLDSTHAHGVAITGLAKGPTLPLTLAVSSDSEPDVTQDGVDPVEMDATVTVQGMTKGKRYVVFRFDKGNAVVPDKVKAYFNVADWALSVVGGNSSTFVWKDPHKIWSNTTVAYRAVLDPRKPPPA